MAHLEYYENVRKINDDLYESHKQLIENVCQFLKCPERVDEISSKFLDEKLKLKAKRDPNQPKKNKSAYMFFCGEERGSLAKMTCTDMAKELGSRWCKLTDAQKAKYVEMAEGDKSRYNQEMESYKNNLFA